MKIRNRWPLHLLFIAFAVLGIRWAWTLTVSETGWRPHLDQWVNVAGSFVGYEKTPLGDRDPEEQAEFWLEEVHQIEAVHDDPQIAMGAAWILDTPQFEFIKRHVRMRDDLDLPGLPASAQRELDEGAIAAMTEEFESLCRDECLSRIDTAVRLAPENVELRRAQALLLFQTKFMSLDFEPRHDDWIGILDECAEVDPDNALYDYLAAFQLWTSSADYDWREDGYDLNVKNAEAFANGTARLAAGLTKPYLRFGTDGYAATLAFLEKSSVPRSEQVDIAGSRCISTRATSMLYRILRWQSVQLDERTREGKFDAAAAAARTMLHIADQISEEGNYPYFATPKSILRQWSLANLEDLIEEHSNLLSEDEAEQISSEFAEAQLEMKILEEVGERLNAKAGTTEKVASPDTSSSQTLLTTTFLMIIAQMLVIVTLPLALIAWAGARLLGKPDGEHHAALGWGRHVSAWLCGIGISFVLFGMVPAKIVSPGLQTWLVRGLIWIGLTALMIGVLHLYRKWFQLPWRQVAGLVIATAFPVFAVFHWTTIRNAVVRGTATLHPIFSIFLFAAFVGFVWIVFWLLSAFVRNLELTRRRKFFATGIVLMISCIAVPAGTMQGMMTLELQPQVWISPTVWPEARQIHVGPEELQSEMNLKGSTWVWAIIQWQAHLGPVFASLTAVAVLLTWHLIRQGRRAEGSLRQILRFQKRRQIRLSGNVVARSCLVASLVFSLFYLATTPRVAVAMDMYYRERYNRLADPSYLRDEIAEVKVQVESDEETMKRLQAEVDERNRRLAEQEAWED